MVTQLQTEIIWLKPQAQVKQEIHLSFSVKTGYFFVEIPTFIINLIENKWNGTSIWHRKHEKYW